MSSFLWLLLYLAPLLGLTAALFGWFGWQWRGSDLLKRIQDLNAQIDDAQKALRESETEHAAALNRAVATEPPQPPEPIINTAELQSLRAELQAAQNELRLQQDASAKAREAAQALETESARLLSEMEQLRSARISAQAEAETAKTELAAARAEHSALLQTLSAAETELTRLRSAPPAEAAAAAPAKRKRSTTAKAKAAAPAANLGEKIAALESQLAAQHASLTTLTQERDEWQRRIHSLEEQTPPDAAALGLARRSLADSEKRLTAASAEIERLQTQTRVLRRIEESAASSTVPDDDLTQIKGIKKVISEQLYSHGIRTWRQIALWNEEELRAFSELLAFKNRAAREHWQEQARTLHEAAHGPLP